MTSRSNVEFYVNVLGMPREQAEGMDVVRPDLIPISPEEADELLAQLDDQQ